MSTEIQNNLVGEEWFTALVDELQATIVETITTARESILQGKWIVGESIEKSVKNFERREIYGTKINAILATNLNWSDREIGRCRQFYNKYPDTSWNKALMKLPGGKELSWHKMVSDYLPENPSGDKEERHYMNCWIDHTAKTIGINSKYKDYKIIYFDKNEKSN